MAADNTASEVTARRGKASIPKLIVQAASAILACVGIAERGPVDVLVECSSIEDWKSKFGDYTANNLETVAAVEGAFVSLNRLFFVRTTHHGTVGDPTSKTSSAATLNLMTGTTAKSAGAVLSSNTAPFVIAAGHTLQIAIDAAAPATATFIGTPGARKSANTGPFALADQDTLLLSFNGAAVTKTFQTQEFITIAAATPQEVVSALNAYFLQNGVLAIASVNAGAVVVTSLVIGSASSAAVLAGGTAAAPGKLNFVTGATNGTGNVGNLAGVSVAEVKTVVEAAVPGAVVTNVAGAARVASTTLGASSSVQIIGASTALAELGFDSALHAGGAGLSVATLRVTAEDGSYANTINAIIAPATSGTAVEFDLQFAQNGSVVDTFPNLTMNPASPRYALTVVNGQSKLGLKLLDLAAGASPANMPAFATVGPMVGGGDGLVGLVDSDFSGGVSANGKTGFRVFDGTEAITLMNCPQRATAAVSAAMRTYCDVTRSQLVFAIHDPPPSLTVAGMVNYVRNIALLTESAETSVVYYPRIKIATPSEALFGKDNVVIPPSGDIAAAYARVDGTKTVGGAFLHPGGTDVTLPRMLGVESDEVLDKSKRNLLTAALVNPISREDNTPFFLDGVLTCLSTGPFPTIGASRGAMIVAKSLIVGLAFARHKNNTPELRSSCAKLADAFMTLITNAGVLATRKAADAYQVDFGKGLNPPSIQRQRRLRGRVGIAYAEPADFIDVEIFPDTRALEAELAKAA